MGLALFSITTFIFDRHFSLYSISIALFLLFYIYRRTDYSRMIYHFTLAEEGLCQLSQDSAQLITCKHTKAEQTLLLQLLPQSRVGFIGFWLVFINEGELGTQYQAGGIVKYRQFIFKDSLSKIDHARLSRTILRIKNTSCKQTVI